MIRQRTTKSRAQSRIIARLVRQSYLAKRESPVRPPEFETIGVIDEEIEKIAHKRIDP